MNPHNWSGLTVLVTGVCGTIGGELLRRLAAEACARITAVDHDETGLFFLMQKYLDCPHVEFSLCDLRDRDGLLRNCRDVDVVLHAAALKHVELCERDPREAIATNVNGLQNLIDAAQSSGVQRVLFMSSDKAVNPAGVMGISKLMGERTVTAAHAHRRSPGDPIFASTRFGNVLGSRGSVVPLFVQQISAGGPVTLTHESMTRFLMTPEDAVELVLESTFIARGGEVFVTKMPAVRVADLAAVMIEELAAQFGYRPGDIAITVMGCRPGEKLHDELITEEEMHRTVELQRYFVVTPALRSLYVPVEYEYDDVVCASVDRPYKSSLEPLLSPEVLASYARRYSRTESARVSEPNW